mmetsp:Transcript_28632/g.66353  ORF Transcript_28632/g.66353 Transcript_28632/m.66353 type:complete len:979 (+) Transcript_28632:182-3118(+)
MLTPTPTVTSAGGDVGRVPPPVVTDMTEPAQVQPGHMSVPAISINVDAEDTHYPTPPASRRSSSTPSQGGRTEIKSVAHMQSVSTKNQVSVPRMRTMRLLETKAFKTVSIVSLLVALFGSSLFILLDVPDEPGIIIQDIVMSVATCIFTLEMLLRGFAERFLYVKSPFFAMDLVGTWSMIFEMSFLLGSAGKMMTSDSGVNTILLRTARAAKVAARAGRLTRLMKCLSVVRGDADHGTLERRSLFNETMLEARVLNKRLMSAVGTRVSLLTVALVIGIPLLGIGRYPEEDLSMKAWMERLEHEYRQSVNSLTSTATASQTDEFSNVVVAFDGFYDHMYFPFKLEGYPEEVQVSADRTVSVPGADRVLRKTPARKQNIFRQRIQSCEIERSGCSDGARAASFFDFTRAGKFDAGMDIAVMLFVVLCMMLESFSLSVTLDIMVVKPIERMQMHVRMLAKVLSVAGRLHSAGEDAGGDEGGQISFADLRTMDAFTEAELMEKVFAKLGKLTALFMETAVVSQDDMVQLDGEARGVLVEMLGFEQNQAGLQFSKQLTSQFGSEPRTLGESTARTCDFKIAPLSLPVDTETINSWDLQILPMSPADQRSTILYMFFDSEIGQLTSRCHIDFETFQTFSDTVQSAYLDNPYHNFAHACDVTATVFRMSNRLDWEDWLTDVELYSLMVSAFVHDIGHIGRTNVFLLETMHELAIRYNDKSPLENMHCAKLFEICNETSTNVFKQLNKEAAKHSRKVCITSILHTDNAMHFEMVKDVKKVYEVSSELCDGWAAQRLDAEGDVQYKEMLQNNTMLWLKLILHMADISTPLKPFFISRQWATLVQDEFFEQGDEEKRLNLPVGMLNDRDKVSRAGSEHGFINFLVSPLVIASVGIFPELIELAENMAHNMQEWRSLWVEQTQPSQEDVKKRDVDVLKVRDQVDELLRRGTMDDFVRGMHSGTITTIRTRETDLKSIALSKASGRILKD